MTSLRRVTGISKAPKRARRLRLAREKMGRRSSTALPMTRQSSSGNMTVMAGRGSSRSRGPQVATSFTSRAFRLSLRT